jgi:hypothetical protein
LNRNSTERQLIVGAVAGLAGAAAMHGFRALWNSVVGESTRNGIFGLDREADINSVRMLRGALRDPAISDAKAESVALRLHYAYGCSAGVFYALCGKRVALLRMGSGTAFGGVLWLVGDELPISIFGVSNPRTKSLASHGSALAVHLQFGAAVESAVSLCGLFIMPAQHRDRRRL